MSKKLFVKISARSCADKKQTGNKTGLFLSYLLICFFFVKRRFASLSLNIKYGKYDIYVINTDIYVNNF